MGIKITYRGSLRDPDLVDALVADLQGLAQRMGWQAWTYEELVEKGEAEPSGLRGVTLKLHPRCELLHLHVDEAGLLVNHFYHAMVHDKARFKQVFDMLRENQRQLEELGFLGSQPAPKGAEAARGQNMEAGPKVFSPDLTALDLGEGLRYNWITTQSGGVEAHVAACETLDHVKTCYAPDLEVEDDAGYFEHRDLERLQVRLAEIDFVIDRFNAAAGRLAEERTPELTTVVELIDKLMEYFDEARQKPH